MLPTTTQKTEIRKYINNDARKKVKKIRCQKSHYHIIHSQTLFFRLLFFIGGNGVIINVLSYLAEGGGDSPVQCPLCDKKYRHQNNLRTHIRCYHKGVRIPCPICGRGFTRWFTVRCHINREHANIKIDSLNLPAQYRRAPNSSANHEPSRSSHVSYQEDLRLVNSTSGIPNYGENDSLTRAIQNYGYNFNALHQAAESHNLTEPDRPTAAQ